MKPFPLLFIQDVLEHLWLVVLLCCRCVSRTLTTWTSWASVIAAWTAVVVTTWSAVVAAVVVTTWTSVSAASRLLPVSWFLSVIRFLIAGCGLFQFRFTSRNAQYQYANDYGVY